MTTKSNKSKNNLLIIDDEEKVEKRKKSTVKVLDKCYADGNTDTIEIGVDEAGRGPMMGRVYTAAVILVNPICEVAFNHSLMKDSKKFHSEKKIREAAEYIKQNAIAWCVTYSDEAEVDSVNIRNATHNSMHRSIKGVMKSFTDATAATVTNDKFHLLIDGNDFKPVVVMDDKIGLVQIQHTCIEGGDNKYSAIAAASILAKVERDKYIRELCNNFPKLNIYYGLLTNKGYGTSKHIEAIKKYGISKWHRTTYGCCKEASINDSEDFYKDVTTVDQLE